MTRCEIEAISALIDGELPESDAARLRGHLEECPSCRALFDDFTALKNGFEALQTDPPDTLLPGIMYKAELGEAPSRLKRVIGSLLGVAAVAAAVIILTQTGMLPQTYDGTMAKELQNNSAIFWEYSAAGDYFYDEDGGEPLPARDPAVMAESGESADMREWTAGSDALDNAEAPAPAPPVLRAGIDLDYDAFLRMLSDSGFSYVEHEYGHIQIGEEPFERLEVDSGTLRIVLYVGEGIDITGLFKEGRR
jgi:hypothetical protein